MRRRAFVAHTGAVAALTAILVLASFATVAGGQSARVGEAPRIPVRPAVGPQATRPAPDRVVPSAVLHAATHSSTRWRPNLLVGVRADMPISARPGGGKVIGTLPAASKYYRVPTIAWVMHVSPDGKYGEVAVPYSVAGATGWISLRGLNRERTSITVRASLSRHEIVVERGGTVILRFPAATGAPSTPTPTGRYFVTDRVSFPSGGSLGTFAFGISGIQPRLPAGWAGGNQLAIHGTDDPSSIGTSTSAGCLRVSAHALARLEPLLRLGTPVIITR